MTLLELYHPMLLEVAGRRIDVRDFPDDVQVAWDKFAQENGVGRAEFIERSGRIMANAKGRGWFEWHAGLDGGTWIAAEKPGPALGRDPGWSRPSGEKRLRREPEEAWRAINWRSSSGLWDIFSKEIVGYTRNLERAISRVTGKDWEQMIDDEWGAGTARRVIKEMWDRFWTDHEALMQLVFFFDQAQRGTVDQYDLSAQIGPRFDWNGNIELDPWVATNERKQRVLSSDYFDQLRQSGGGSGM